MISPVTGPAGVVGSGLVVLVVVVGSVVCVVVVLVTVLLSTKSMSE